MTGSPVDLDATALLEEYGRRRVSPVEAVDAALDRMASCEPILNAVVHCPGDSARAAARESERRWISGTARPLEGVPVGLKDLIDVAGLPTSGGSAIYRHDVAEHSAAVWQQLEAAGAVLVAKLTTFEFAYGEAVNQTFGATANPWAPERTAGGSSCGPAAALAGRYLPIAIGTDTGGSIREPSSFCGLSGLKPTYGLVSTEGVMPLSWTLDHVGPMARSVRDLRLAMSLLAGSPPGAEVPPCQGLRVGVPKDWFYDLCDPEVAAATARLGATLVELGATLVDVELPQMPLAEAIGWTIMLSEMTSLHADHRREGSVLDSANALAVLAGDMVRGGDYLRAQRLRGRIRRVFAEALTEADCLLLPGTIAPALPLDTMSTTIDGRTCRYMEDFLRTMLPINVVGLPSLALPTGLHSTGLPMGAQLVGRQWADDHLLAIGCAVQTATDHHTAQPPATLSKPRDVGSSASPDAWIPGGAEPGAPLPRRRSFVDGAGLSASQERALDGLSHWLDRQITSLYEVPVPYRGAATPAEVAPWPGATR
ncbi:MAG: aspartyl-tRNA(Asn)/glutamyl-tRNA(Gln) amidotransferase subunit [Frankiales bacterium]|nr:aspartyl-tRNA(Asn)/glutamyl-tRNA(Gln) amidotransferase subunit [Frankiales bacterium]